MEELITRHDDMAWRTLESKYLIRRPWMTVRLDKVELPNGNVNPEFYVLEYMPWVNVIAITEDGEFLMVRQYRYGLRDTRYEIVAGAVEDGEEPLHAAQRELLEETGFGGGTWREFCVMSVNCSSHNNLTHTFLAEGVRKVAEAHQEPTEDVHVHFLSREQVLQLLREDEIKQASMATGLLKYFLFG